MYSRKGEERDWRNVSPKEKERDKSTTYNSAMAIFQLDFHEPRESKEEES